ncbi:uncharacterized protein LOC124371166 [Homalodisca vitripennis]|uniref:uncharacterized protein LOC124371166 n=1 Tax=Homalodisca vitripennis TaxID=197043 RepID=UPI001EEB8F29|nr:uncharacterized protein LOC124371166 [Homalodisca vitripennis]
MKDNNYHNRHASNRAWEAVAIALGKTSETVTGKWKNLRDTFRRELKKVPGYRSGSDGDQAPKYTGHWPYFERMLFLRGVMTPRPTDSNMSVTDEERNENNIDTITHESDPDDPGNSIQSHVDVGSNSEVSRSVKNLYTSNNDQVQTAPYISKRRKLTGSEQFKADILALEAKKINMLEKDSDQSDDDLNFFKSLLPHMKTLPAVNKLFFRSKVQNMLAKEMMNANRPHYATFPNTFVRTTPQTPVTTPETTSHATTSSGKTPASTPDVIVHQDLNTDETQSQSILLWNLN